MKTLTVVSLLFASANMALGNLSINLGNTATDNVAWPAGGDPCTNNYINPYGQNPCGIIFYVNGAGYALKNCGTSPYEAIPADGGSPLVCNFVGNYQTSCDEVTLTHAWTCTQ